MSTNIITVEDMNYLTQQSSGNLNMILSGMTALMNDNDSKVEMLENQTWFQRMSNTISGKNKMTQQEIQQNHDRINMYMSQAMTELFNQNCIDHQIMMSLGNQINELYADHIQLKQMLGAFVGKLNEKIESIDNFHILNTEIEQGVYSNYSSIVSMCMVLSQIDSRTMKDERKLDILRRSMATKNIITDNSVGLREIFLELLNISMDDVGTVYLELETLRGDFLADIFINVIESYYFLPDLARKMKNKDLVVNAVMNQNQLDDSIALNIAEVYDQFIEAKKNHQYVQGIEMVVEEDNATLKKAEKAVLNYQIEDALEILGDLIEEDNGRAMYLAGICYLWCVEFANYKKSKKLFKKGFKQGDILSAIRYARLEVKDDSEKEEIFAANLAKLRQLAEAGNPFAEYEYATLNSPELTEFSGQEQIDWFAWMQKSSEHGFWWATFKLAEYYEKGIGTESDDELAFKCYEKAYRASGSMLYQVILPLADCYFYGLGTEEDDEKARDLYQAFLDRNKRFEQCDIMSEEASKILSKIPHFGRATYNLANLYFAMEGEEASMLGTFILSLSTIANYPSALYMSAEVAYQDYKNDGSTFSLEEAREYIDKAKQYVDKEDDKLQLNINLLDTQIEFAEGVQWFKEMADDI